MHNSSFTKIPSDGAEETAQWLRTIIVFTKDLGLDPSNPHVSL